MKNIDPTPDDICAPLRPGKWFYLSSAFLAAAAVSSVFYVVSPAPGPTSSHHASQDKAPSTSPPASIHAAPTPAVPDRPVRTIDGVIKVLR